MKAQLTRMQDRNGNAVWFSSGKLVEDVRVYEDERAGQVVVTAQQAMRGPSGQPIWRLSVRPATEDEINKERALCGMTISQMIAVDAAKGKIIG